MLRVTPFRGRQANFESFALEDPIPQQINDTAELSRFMDQHKIIPYASTDIGTGDSTRALYQRLSLLSPTHAGCIKGKCSAAFVGDIKLNRNNLFMDKIEVPANDIKDYSEIFKNVRYGNMNYNKFLYEIGRSYEAVGECFVKAFIQLINGSYFCTLSIMPHPRSYLRYYDRKENTFLYAPKIREFSMDDSQEYALFPELTEERLGYSTILHIKNGCNYYGVPPSRESYIQQYNEFQNSLYLLRQGANNFVGQLFIEYSGDNPDRTRIVKDQALKKGFASVAREWRENTSASGRQQAVITSERPWGASAATVTQFAPNTNHEFYRACKEINSDYIVVTHCWSHVLLGEQMKGSLNSQDYYKEFMIKMVTVIPDLRFAVLNELDKIYQLMMRLNGREDLSDVAQDIMNPLYKLLLETGEGKPEITIKKAEA